MRAGKKDSSVRDRVIAYKHAFSSEMGRKVLFDLMNQFHILNAHKGDAYAEGQRSVVLHILHQSKINLEHLDKLLEGDI